MLPNEKVTRLTMLGVTVAAVIVCSVFVPRRGATARGACFPEDCCYGCSEWVDYMMEEVGSSSCREYSPGPARVLYTAKGIEGLSFGCGGTVDVKFWDNCYPNCDGEYDHRDCSPGGMASEWNEDAAVDCACLY